MGYMMYFITKHTRMNPKKNIATADSLFVIFIMIVSFALLNWHWSSQIIIICLTEHPIGGTPHGSHPCAFGNTEDA